MVTFCWFHSHDLLVFVVSISRVQGALSFLLVCSSYVGDFLYSFYICIHQSFSAVNSGSEAPIRFSSTTTGQHLQRADDLMTGAVQRF